MAERFRNALWMKTMAARACFEAGDCARAGLLSHEVNGERPTVDTLLLEAQIHRQRGDFEPAIRLLGRAEQLLGGDLISPARAAANVCST
jgi:hypothetical protein